MVVIGIGGLVSLAVSFWVFFMSEVPRLNASFRNEQSTMLNKSPLMLGQIHPFYLESGHAILEVVNRTIDATFLYPRLAEECLKSAPSWITRVTSQPDDTDNDNHWSFRAKNVIVFVSADCPPDVVKETLESDPIIAGMTIAWFGVDHTEGSLAIPKGNLHYPRDFLQGPVSGAPLHVKKIGCVWATGDDKEALEISEFCEYDRYMLWQFVMNECIPVVASEDLDKMPLSRLIRWESVTAQVTDPETLREKARLKKRALSAIREFLSELSDTELFALNLAFS